MEWDVSSGACSSVLELDQRFWIHGYNQWLSRNDFRWLVLVCVGIVHSHLSLALFTDRGRPFSAQPCLIGKEGFFDVCRRKRQLRQLA